MHDDCVFVIGGKSGDSTEDIVQSDVWRSDQSVSVFSEISQSNLLQRWSATAVSFNESIYLIGGYCTSEDNACILTEIAVLSSNDGFNWNKVKIIGYAWSQISFGFFGGTVVANAVYLSDGAASFKLTGTGNPSLLKCELLGPISIERSNAIFLSFYSSLWIISGLTSSSQYCNDIYASFDLGESWNWTDQLTDANGFRLAESVFARSQGSGVMFDNQICIMGGQSLGSNNILCSVPPPYPAPAITIASSPKTIVDSGEIIVFSWAVVEIAALSLPGIPGLSSLRFSVIMDDILQYTDAYSVPFNVSTALSLTEDYLIIANPDLDPASVFVFRTNSVGQARFTLRNQLPHPKFDPPGGQVSQNVIIKCTLGYVRVIEPESLAGTTSLSSAVVVLPFGTTKITANCILLDWPPSSSISSTFFVSQPPSQPQRTLSASTSLSVLPITSISSSLSVQPTNPVFCSSVNVRSIQLCCLGNCSCEAAGTAGGDIILFKVWGYCIMSAVMLASKYSNQACENLLCSQNTCSCRIPGGVGNSTVSWKSAPNITDQFQVWEFSYAKPIETYLLFDPGNTITGGQLTIYGKNFGVFAVPQLCPCSYQSLGYSSQIFVGDSEAHAILWTSDTSITASVLSGVGRQLLVSLWLQGEQASEVSMSYSYDAPTLTGASSSLGPIDGGLVLTLYGSSFGSTFTGGTEVFLLESETSVTYSLTVGQFVFSPSTNSTCNKLLWTSDSSVACTTPAGYGLNKKLGIAVTLQLAVSSPIFNFVEWSTLVLINCSSSLEYLNSPVPTALSDTGTDGSVLQNFLSWLKLVLNLESLDQIYVAGIKESGVNSNLRKSVTEYVSTIELHFLEAAKGNSMDIQQILNRLEQLAKNGLFNASMISVTGIQIGTNNFATSKYVSANVTSKQSVETSNATPYIEVVLSVVFAVGGAIFLIIAASQARRCKFLRFNFLSTNGRFQSTSRVASELVWFRGVLDDFDELPTRAVLDVEEHGIESLNNVTDDNDLCCICLDAKREAVIVHDDTMRSRHKALCIGCAYKIVDSTATCPLCRLPILAVLHDPTGS